MRRSELMGASSVFCLERNYEEVQHCKFNCLGAIWNERCSWKKGTCLMHVRDGPSKSPY